jgi:hypothetical protein
MDDIDNLKNEGSNKKHLPPLKGKVLYDLYKKHTGFKAILKLQKETIFSSCLMIIPLLIAICVILFSDSYCTKQQSEWLVPGAVGFSFFFFFLATKVRDQHIKKTSDYSNFKSWLLGQQFAAYEEAKKLFKDIDVNEVLIEVFPEKGSFMDEYKGSLMLFSAVAPVWVAYVNGLEHTTIIKLLLLLVIISLFGLYINWFYKSITKSNRQSFLDWLRRCVEVQKGEEKK